MPPSWTRRLREKGPVFVPVIHLAPLPGSPRAELALEEIWRRAWRDAALYAAAGADAIILENHGDAPFLREGNEPHVAALMAVLAERVRRDVGLPVGLNVLRNDALAAMGAAVAGEAAFIRVNVLTGVSATDQGLISGCAAELLRYRRRLDAKVAILADVEVKFATPLYRPTRASLARATLERGGADALIVTGAATGAAADLEAVAEVKAAVGSAAVLVGSGVTEETLPDVLARCDGVIVGSALKREGRVDEPVDPARLESFARALAAFRA